MAKKVEITIEEKLRALFDLQLIDSRIDEIRNIRGELPLEVEDLENEIEGSNVKVEKITTEIDEFKNNIKDHKNLHKNLHKGFRKNVILYMFSTCLQNEKVSHNVSFL